MPSGPITKTEGMLAPGDRTAWLGMWDSTRFQADLIFARWRLDCVAGHVGLEPPNPSASYLIGIP
jgi:hypothetical protein